jgi:SAM-dependent methyltransferase
VLDGIPDFRVFPDPFLDFDEDRERTRRILEVLHDHTFPSLLEFYWSLSDITPPALRPAYIRSALGGESRARRIWRLLESSRAATAGPIVEIGSGTGDFLAVAAAQGAQVVGTDIAMRWLHLSRRRFLDCGLPVPPLVCCCVEYLPFRDEQFQSVVSVATLEFVREPERMMAESARVIRRGGTVLLNTANRYSLARDPYARLWGVGFLPRGWQPRYVRWRNGVCYEHTRSLSLGEVRRTARRHFARCDVRPADVDEESVARASPGTQLAIRLYRQVACLALGRALLNRIAPQWDVLLDKPRRRPRSGVCNDSGPAVSVVIASVSGLGPVVKCLEALERQINAPSTEILVIDRTGPETRSALRRRFPQIHVVGADEQATVGELRAQGIGVARGRIVAITEDHCLPAPDWLRTIAAAHAAGHSVLGGCVENASASRFIDRAAFLCEYGRFLDPLRAGAATDLSGNNVAYDRGTLLEFAAEWRSDYCETILHRRMRSAGVELHCEPAMRVRHEQSLTLRAFLRARFDDSRAFASGRTRALPLAVRIIYALATPLLPLLLMLRAGCAALAKRGHWRAFLLAAPLFCLFFIVGAIGEAVGAIWGGNRSSAVR